MVAFYAYTLVFTSALSLVTALQSAIQRERTIEVAPHGDQCTAKYPNRFLHVYKHNGKNIFWKDTVSKTSVAYSTDGVNAIIRYTEGEKRLGEAKGSEEHLDEIFARVFPFAHIKNDILARIPTNQGYVWYMEQCVELIDYIEGNPPPEYKNDTDWIKSFVDRNVAEALSLAQLYGITVTV